LLFRQRTDGDVLGQHCALLSAFASSLVNRKRIESL
jgi:hypothetical protein